MPLGVDRVPLIRVALHVVHEATCVYANLSGAFFLVLVCMSFKTKAAEDTAIAVAPEPGPWQYTAVRCGPVYGPF